MKEDQLCLYMNKLIELVLTDLEAQRCATSGGDDSFIIKASE